MSETSPHHSSGRIVVGIDGSEPSKDALRWAMHQAQLTGSRVEAIIAWHPPVTYGAPVPLPNDFDLEKFAGQAVRDAIESVTGDHPAVEVSTKVIEGNAAPTLVEAAEGADLLVVGSRGHGAFAGMLLGSVSDHAVSHSPCPVVVVRHGTGLD